MHHDATWCGGRLQPGDFVFDGDPAHLPKKGALPCPIFGPCLYCGQTAGWIKMALNMEVGLGPGHIVLDGEPAAIPQNGTELPNFGPFLLSPNGWMHQDAAWYGGRPQPRRLYVRWGPSYPQNRGHIHHHPVFGPCLLWSNGWMDEDATWYGKTSAEATLY